MDYNQIADFKLLIESQSFLLGNRETLTPFEVTAITDMIQGFYKWVTYDKFRNAFTCYSAGVLDIKKEQYGIMTREFVGAVLTAYNAYFQKKESEEKKRKEDEEKENSLKLPGHEYTDKDAFDFIERWHKQKGVVPLVAEWKRAARHLQSLHERYRDEEAKNFYREFAKTEIEKNRKLHRAKLINHFQSDPIAIASKKFLEDYLNGI